MKKIYVEFLNYLITSKNPEYLALEVPTIKGSLADVLTVELGEAHEYEIKVFGEDIRNDFRDKHRKHLIYGTLLKETRRIPNRMTFVIPLEHLELYRQLTTNKKYGVICYSEQGGKIVFNQHAKADTLNSGSVSSLLLADITKKMCIEYFKLIKEVWEKS